VQAASDRQAPRAAAATPLPAGLLLRSCWSRSMSQAAGAMPTKALGPGGRQRKLDLPLGHDLKSWEGSN